MSKDKSLDSTELDRTHRKTRIQQEAHSLQMVPVDNVGGAPDLQKFLQCAQSFHCARRVADDEWTALALIENPGHVLRNCDV